MNGNFANENDERMKTTTNIANSKMMANLQRNLN